MNCLIKCLLALGLVFSLAACDPTNDLTDAPVDLGDFKLGHNIVVTPNLQALPGSRQATEEEWQTAMKKAIDARFGRYEGETVYHFGISVDAYNLAVIDVPGVPAPKSALAVNVTVWDNAKGVKLNNKAKTITVLGVFSGTGIQPKREVQINNLAALAAKSIEKWMLENPEWFGLPPVDG